MRVPTAEGAGEELKVGPDSSVPFWALGRESTAWGGVRPCLRGRDRA